MIKYLYLQYNSYIFDAVPLFEGGDAIFFFPGCVYLSLTNAL